MAADVWGRGLSALNSGKFSEELVRAYLLAKRQVVGAGFEHEIVWQENVSPSSVTDRSFLREAAWVILCSGMRESVIRRLFSPIGEAMLGWVPAEVSEHQQHCRERALTHYRHVKKIEAIIRIAIRVSRGEREKLMASVELDGPTALTSLPYIGPTTCFHLAKNLGFQVPKPDRHLLRIAERCGLSVDELCTSISDVLDEPVPVVDVVLWRYATLQENYLDLFRL
ncbi:MAG: hypothetical protein AAFN41_11815 [Planctomycetota bacterium]